MAEQVTAIKSRVGYDYVIIGGGTAGSIVAARLSQKCTVLLLERGNSVSWCNPLISDPKNWTLVDRDPSLEWGYESVPQKHMNNRIIRIPRAKALGGCQVSVILAIAHCKNNHSKLFRSSARVRFS